MASDATVLLNASHGYPEIGAEAAIVEATLADDFRSAVLATPVKVRRMARDDHWHEFFIRIFSAISGDFRHIGASIGLVAVEAVTDCTHEDDVVGAAVDDLFGFVGVE